MELMVLKWRLEGRSRISSDWVISQFLDIMLKLAMWMENTQYLIIALNLGLLFVKST